MSKVTTDKVEQYIADTNPSVEVLIDKFGHEFNHWTLRTLRRDVLADLARNQVSPGAALSSSPVQELGKAARVILDSGILRPINLKLQKVERVKPTFTTNGKVWLVGSDAHAPDHDIHAVDVFLQVGQSLPLEGVVLAGDWMDVHALSKYTKAAHRPFRWKEEREQAVPVVAEVRQTFPDERIIYLPGNHCVRPESFIASKVPELQGLPELALPSLLGLQDLDFEWRSSFSVAQDQLLIKHGTRVSKHGGQSVQKEVEQNKISIIMGHVHRRALYEVTSRGQRMRGEMPWIGVELGCLCGLTPDYLAPEDTANWQHGFAVVTEYDNGIYDVELVRVHDGFAMFRGHQFRSRHLPVS